MSAAEVQFSKRLRRIVRRHDKMRNGVIHRMTRDGLIVAHPRRHLPRFPLQGVMIVVAAGILFKSFLLLNMGEITYGERVASLQSGSLIEQGGAWVMQIDPATNWIADQMKPYLN
jgi:hypothetical protein